jgi:RNA polymerase sigma-70 factor, ECF subfamily
MDRRRDSESTPGRPGSDPAAETRSEELIRRFQAGDQEAFNRLWNRYLPRLKRWAHHRLPKAGRSGADTDDLIQDAFVRSLARVRTFESRGPNTVFAYFRTIVLNLIRDYGRLRTPPPASLDLETHEPVDPCRSQLEEMLGAEALEQYQKALDRLPADDQAIILAVIELRCTDRELAELFEKPTANAARMARGRAVARLARAMEDVLPAEYGRAG